MRAATSSPPRSAAEAQRRGRRRGLDRPQPGAPANGLACTSALGDPDTDCGSGFIQADRVLAAALAPPPSGGGGSVESGGSSPTAQPPAPPAPPPLPPNCKVPKLKGKSLRAAKKALRLAHCTLGKVRPKHPPRHAVVESSSPGKGAVRPGGTKVNVALGAS